MAENKFIQHLKGKATAGSVVEIKNQATPASFANMPSGTSNANNVYADVRGNATVVAEGTTSWKLDGANLVLASNVSGDGNDYTGVYGASGTGLWVSATYTFPSTGDPNHPVAMIFNPNTKWVLKLCGDNLLANGANTIDFYLVITIGSGNIITKNFTVAEQANKFCKEFIIDFAESNQALIKAQGTTNMRVQLLCATASATARIYNGMTVFTTLQRKVDASTVSADFANVEEVLRDGILPSDYFSNAEFIEQVEDGEQAYAVFERDGDNVNLSGWTPKDDIATTTQLNTEIQNRINADNALGLRIDDEITARENADSVLQGNIDTVAGDLSVETTARENADTALQGQITNNKNAIDTHIADTDNPHQVTKAQVGLGNVDNTADTDKPVSTAQQAALDGKQNISTNDYQMGNASGGWTTMTTAQQNALNSGATTTKINAIATNTQAIADEVARATGAESALSERITANTNNFANYRTAAAQDAIDATLATKTELGNETSARQNADAVLQENIDAESTARESADNALQTQIDAIVSKSDVVDIVGTYAELQAYDTSALGNNDVVKVISDSTHNNAPSFYRWVITGGVGAWVYIGSESASYTKAETDALLNEKQDTLTTAQQAAVDSGITTTKRTAYDNHLTNTNNPHSVTKAQVGLSNVDNTSDLNKPISTATQEALDGKQNTISDLATIRSGAALGATAVQPSDLATVATSGSYNDLSNKPTIPAAQVNSDWNANSGVAQILNKPTLGTAAAADTTDFATAAQGALADTAVQPADLAPVATSGQYSDLSNKPTIPTVNNPTITITQGGVTKGSFTLNQASGDTIALDAGGGGGSVDIDNTTITENASQEIQAVAVIDQNTGIAKTWTGTMAEYDAIATKDPETEYIITDDIGLPATEIGQITEALNNKADVSTVAHVVVEFQKPTAANNYTWYRKYADGWVEQGGRLTQSGSATLPIEMSDNNYNLQVRLDYYSTGTIQGLYWYATKTTTGFTMGTFSTAIPVDWQTSGMAA